MHINELKYVYISTYFLLTLSTFCNEKGNIENVIVLIMTFEYCTNYTVGCVSAFVRLL